MRCKEKVTLKYSKARKEFIVRYPEYTNRNGGITGSFFSHLYDLAESRVIDLGYESLRDYFDKGGFDIDTFTISINAKIGQTQNIRNDGKQSS